MSEGHHPEHQFTLVRVVDAPPAAVYAMWSSPAHLARWWPQPGFELLHTEIDLRPGGVFQYRMRAPDGSDAWVRGVYREIEPSARLVFSFVFEDSIATVSFAPHGEDGTELTLHQGEFDNASLRNEYENGWTESLQRLAAYAQGAELATS